MSESSHGSGVQLFGDHQHVDDHALLDNAQRYLSDHSSLYGNCLRRGDFVDSAAHSSASSCVFEKETGSARRLGDSLPGDGSAGCGGLLSRLRWWRVHTNHHTTTPSDPHCGEFGLSRHHHPVGTPQEAQHRNGMAGLPFRFLHTFPHQNSVLSAVGQ